MGVSEFTWSTSREWGKFSPEPLTLAPTSTTAGYQTDAGCIGEGVKPGHNVIFKPTPVCVYPPFVFIVSNAIQNFKSI